MKTQFKLIVRCFPLFLFMVACGQSKLDSELFSSLPEYCNTPDAMAFDETDSTIVLSVPNFNDTRYPGVIVKVNMNGEVAPFFPAPVHPETGKGAPMGLEFGPDGNLYYADNQYFFDKNYKSRVIRVVIQDGKAVRAETVVENLKLANAIRWKGRNLYVSETFFDLGDPKKEGWGGIYSVSLEEMNKGSVRLIADKTKDDPHLVVKAKVTPNHRKDIAGFDGMCFDKDGNLYSGNFGDGQFYKVAFDAQNKVKSFEVIDHSLNCVDGICYDNKRDVIYIADSENNAIHQWDVQKKKMTTLAENEDNDGASGLMDQPCEPLIIGNKIVIANFDMPFPGLKNSAYDKVHSLSVIDLK